MTHISDRAFARGFLVIAGSMIATWVALEGHYILAAGSAAITLTNFTLFIREIWK